MFDWLRRLLLRVEATGGAVAAAGSIINSPITTGLGEEDVERRHREQMAGQEEILRAIAKEKGVEEAPLREVLKKLGEANTRFADIPARLNRAAEELIQLRADLARLRNDRPEFAAIRARASALIDKGEFDAARAELRKGREAARALREDISRSEAGFLADEARVDRLQLNYDEACAKFLEATRLDPDNAGIWIDLGDLWVIRGSLTKAGEAFRAATAAAAQSGDERGLSVSHNRIGEVQQAQGDLAAALTSYRASHAIAERLAKTDPGNAGWQRDLALSYGRLAIIEARQGTRDSALSAFRQGRGIIVRLSEQSPRSLTLKNDLAWFDREIATQGK
jgi:tetratricopeptide (TPR) repeat protein